MPIVLKSGCHYQGWTMYAAGLRGRNTEKTKERPSLERSNVQEAAAAWSPPDISMHHQTSTPLYVSCCLSLF